MLKTRDILMLLCGGGLAGALFLLAPASAQHAAPSADPGAVKVAPVATQQGTSPVAGNRACTCPGDFNGDNLINTADLVNFLAVFGTQCAPDTDGDGVPNATDNCPNVPNANQADQDADGVGDVCDNCPTVSNPGQQDSNGNGIGDACENPGCTPGSTQPCASGFPGVCSPGIKTCQANGTWGPCIPNIQPNSQPEVCNGQDDDCDGQVDEGNPCPTVPNGSNNCTGSGCQLVCSPGFANCDGNNANGCEVNINTSTNNCGGCGIVCNLPNATATCVNGVCAIGSCNAGFANCDNNPANGCEVNINTSAANCGGCGITCSLPNATATCINGQCAIGSCNTGFANCNGITADGCEVNINTGTSNCGGCGIQCNLPNATAICINGQCRVGSCNTGWADCDNNPANGCEVNLQTSTSNCGLCGRVCAVGPHVASVSCVSGTCVITGCQAGWFNSNGVYADGCESTTP